MEYFAKAFEDLTNAELYRIMQLRAEVFVVEQNCVYLDQDGKDQNAIHVIGLTADGEINAYTRIVPPGEIYADYVSIGRVITSHKVRRTGNGVSLMRFTINESKKSFPRNKIKISAQYYLLKFYQNLGFQEFGESYLEDGIPHIGMIYSL